MPSENRSAEQVEDLTFNFCRELARASGGDEVAYRVSGALHLLDGSQRLRTTRLQSDQMLRALLSATPAILALFPESTVQRWAVKGIEAAAAQICSLSEAPARRAARPATSAADIRDHARWLRNACHNLALIEQIEERAAQRQSDAIVELKRAALRVAK
ncbi:hypothetical protein EMQ25_00805 [Arsenicitalea aurantiaca]|uniref:Uncharacterized protein n=1 Tax=Arsenicitalea aurantiaca TaxID=1783274 RepID=A0A433XKE1_9HYPH|nr:hypothetical protein [Arsenicitalea aurantiaca]RUT34535.1 hypothetical protein EMQ25_00805 [Arsenicitalea aurantiaca]